MSHSYSGRIIARRGYATHKGERLTLPKWMLQRLEKMKFASHAACNEWIYDELRRAARAAYGITDYKHVKGNWTNNVSSGFTEGVQHMRKPEQVKAYHATADKAYRNLINKS